MSEPLRIAYAIQNVGGINLSLDVGDTVPVKNTLRGLRKAGHIVDCLVLQGRNVISFEDVDNLEKTRKLPLGISGLRPFLFSESIARRLQRGLRIPYFAFFDSYRFYEACLRTLPPYSLCHEHNGLFSIGTALACNRLGIPYILTVSADPIFERSLGDHPLKGVQKAVAEGEARYTYKEAQRIISVSQPAKKNLVENWNVPPEKIVVIPNGVDTELFHPGYDPRPLREFYGLGDDPVVCFVGGFQPWHGVEKLIESFSQVLSSILNAKLLLVGDGRARPVIEKKIAECGIHNSVIITGFLPQSKIPEVLAISDLAVIPYPKLPQELWFSPLKLYEYMAAGKAIIASRSGQIAEVISHGESGYLVEPGDTESLAGAIMELLRNPEKRQMFGLAAREQSVKHHSWAQYIKRLEEIYFEVTNGVS